MKLLKESRATLACLYRTSGRFYMLQQISVDSTLKKTNFGFGYDFLIGSMYKQNINFNQSIKQCCIKSKKYAFLLKVISLWIKVDFAISWRKVKIWLTSTNLKF